jgi:purine-binding chemotaxis protein CheW
MKVKDQQTEQVALQDQVWSVYLQGLLNLSYDVPEAVEAPPAIIAPSPLVVAPAIPSQPVLPPPEWSQSAFQAMLFRVGELVLSTPLITLNRVIRFDQHPIRSLPGRPDWSLGLIDHRGEIINVVDPGRLLLGDAYDSSKFSYRYIILPEQKGWGVVCHEFIDMLKIQPDQVRWCQDRLKRPWLAGVDIQRLCAVIDIERLLPKPTTMTGKPSGGRYERSVRKTY